MSVGSALFGVPLPGNRLGTNREAGTLFPACWLGSRHQLLNNGFELHKANGAASYDLILTPWGFNGLVPLNYHRKDLQMTKNLLKYSLVVLGLALSTSVASHGLAFNKIPEVDPSLAVSGLALLAGTLAVLRVRRKK
jgi:hypothetical protein